MKIPKTELAQRRILTVEEPVSYAHLSAVKEPVVMGKYKACGVFNRMTAFVIFWASFGVLVHGGLGVFMLVTKPKELQGIVIQAAAMMFAIAGAELGIIVALSLYFRKKCPAFLKRGLYFKMRFCGLGVFIKGVFLGIPLSPVSYTHLYQQKSGRCRGGSVQRRISKRFVPNSLR